MTKEYFQNLQVNYRESPIGIDERRLQFRWTMGEDLADEIFDIRVLVHDEKKVLWDSGRIGDRVHAVNAEIPALESQHEYFWFVGGVNAGGIAISSATERFVTGIFDDTGWDARWVSAGVTHPLWRSEEEKAAPYLRRSFRLEAGVRKAILCVCGLGYNETFLNGSKVTSAILTPCLSNYDSTSYYNTYDVTAMLAPGENVLGVVLGNGLYNEETQSIWKFECAPWRHHPKMILRLRVFLDNGEEICIVSDDGFTYTYGGPIVFNALRNGEYYDARREIDGWNRPGFDAAGWKKATYCLPAGGRLRSEPGPLIGRTAVLAPVSVERIGDAYVIDVGQNMSGFLRIRLTGDAGQEITVRYAEKKTAEGRIDASNLNLYVYSGEFQTDRYTFRGIGTEEWEPRFTYHGFRYAEITGYDRELTVGDVRAVLVHTAFASAGEFECSDEPVNAIQRCVRWSTITNFHSIPTDCPHREKNGWTGDAQLSAEHTMYNYFAYNAYLRWLDDIVDTQRPNGQVCSIVPTGGWGYVGSSGPAWDSALIVIPWLMYEFYDDLRVLERYYEPIRKYIGYMTSMASDGIVAFGLGDWCPPDTAEIRCPVEITDTAYYYSDVRTLAKMAQQLGRGEDARHYHKLAEEIKERFQHRFITAEPAMTSECQTAYACALYHGLAREEDRPALAARLDALVRAKDDHLDCGILGTKYLLEALTLHGYAETAYRIVAQRTYPSWGYCIDQGATTFWETWNGKDSMNHHMFATVGTWFYKHLAGIRPSRASLVIQPCFVSALQHVKARHRCVYGEIRSEWRREKNIIEILVQVPEGMEAVFEHERTGRVDLSAGSNRITINMEEKS